MRNAPLLAVTSWQVRALVRADHRRSLSTVLEKIKLTAPCERIAIGDLLLAADDRAFAALLFLFAVPNVLPTPPGTSSALGVPLILLSAQLGLGLSILSLSAVLEMIHAFVRAANSVLQQFAA